VIFTPCASIFSISLTSAHGSTTTPLPMIESLPCTTPEGSSASLYVVSPTTNVCPALWPPWKAHHDIRAVAQPINDFAFALVAPLGADDDYAGHA
jgi:hypothetical protein